MQPSALTLSFDLEDLGVFDGFYQAWLERAAAELATLGLREQVSDVDQFVLSVLTDLKLRLVALASKSLVWSYRTAQGPAAEFPFDGQTADQIPLDGRHLPRERYDRYHGEISGSEGRRNLCDRLPLLERALDEAVTGRVRLVEEILVAATQDDLAATFGPLGRVLSIRTSDGDTHNLGRQVAIVDFEDRQLVYKPHSLLTDCLITELAGTLNRSSETIDQLPLAKSLDAGDHGWQEFITPEQCTSMVEVSMFYHRAGIWLALLAALGVTDIHFENLIAAGAKPYLVDLETLCRWVGQPDTDEIKKSALVELRDSVLNTLMLPVRLPGGAADTNMAALGTTGVEVSGFWSSRGMVARGCDGIRYIEIPSAFEHGANIPKLNGRLQPAQPFADEIRRGFERGVHIIEGCATDLLDVIRDERFDRMPVRQVLRATSLYAAFLDASQHPNYLCIEVEQRRLLHRLGAHSGLPGDTTELILDAEVRALSRGDIPMFIAAFSEPTVKSSDGDVVAVMTGSLRDQMCEVFQRYLRRNHVRDSYYVHTSLATAQVEEGVGAGRLASELFGDDDPEVFADAVCDWIDATSFWTSDGRHCQRISATPLDGLRTALSIADLSSYGDGGALLLLANRVRWGDADAQRLLRASALPANHWPGAVGETNLAAFGGLAGSTYLLHECAETLDDDALRAQRDTCLSQLRSQLTCTRLGADVISGAAGVANTLAQAGSVLGIDMTNELTVLRDQVRDFAAHAAELGFAHGRFGAVAALASINAELGVDDDEAVHLARAAFDELNPAMLDSPARDSWCKGLPGVAAVLAQNPRTHAQLAELAESLMGRERREHPTDISVCHGVAGELMALVSASRALRSQRLASESERRWHLLFDQVRREGYRGGSPGTAGQVGLMTGLSGLAMAGLMMVDSTLAPAYAQCWTKQEVQ